MIKGSDDDTMSSSGAQYGNKPMSDHPIERQPIEHIMQFFAYAHLPEHLANVSAPFANLADQIVIHLPRNPERTVALRKLLEAKDAAVRAMVAK